MSAQVKICGISTIEALDVAIAHDADFIGLVFFGKSPRNVSISQAVPLADHARGKTKIVALTVDADDALLDEIVAQVRPDYIQAHGSESPERIADIKQKTGLPVIKAVKIREQDDVAVADGYLDVADIILFDAKAPDSMANALPGGNAIRFDWSLLKTCPMPEFFMLSGGLTVANIGEAVLTTDAAIFDVSSGVESQPGKKDLAAIKNFIVAMRNAG